MANRVVIPYELINKVKFDLSMFGLLLALGV